MRWVTYRSQNDGDDHVGLVLDADVHGLPRPTSMLDVLKASPADRERYADLARSDPYEDLKLSDAPLRAPIPTPPSIRDFMAFENHVVDSMAAMGGTVDPVWYQQPVFYFTNPAAVIGPHDPNPTAPGTAQWDYELEVAAVIGTPGRNLHPGSAEDHIAGYTILCDWSARDLQATEMKVALGPAKGKDTATSLGPMIVTLDELEPFRKGNGYDLTMSVSVNGRPYSRGNWSDLYWSMGQLIAYASRGTELRTGDVIGSGTVGTGCILELSRVHSSDDFPWLVPGDDVRVEVEQLGVISSTVIHGSDVVPLDGTST